SGKQGISCMNGCHGTLPATQTVTVSLEGPSSLAPGALGDYTLVLQGGPAVSGGLNVALSDETLATLAIRPGQTDLKQVQGGRRGARGGGGGGGRGSHRRQRAAACPCRCGSPGRCRSGQRP